VSNVDKHRTPCVNCGERHVRARKATPEMVSERAFRNIRDAGIGSTMTAICLACFALLIGGDDGATCMICAATAVGFAGVLAVIWWFVCGSPLPRSRKHHYKCSKCGHPWNA
jgi:hypothetical protein